jgi:hypothetical protein
MRPLLLALGVLTSCTGSGTAAPDTDIEPRPERPVRELDPGRVSARRLNNIEYDHTVRDLLFTELRPSARFPADDAAFGFDHMADALSVSPLHVEMYEQAVDELIAVELNNAAIPPQRWTWEAEGPGLVATTGAAMEDYYMLWSNGTLTANFTAPHTGTYRLTARLGQTPAGAEDSRAALLVDGAAVSSVTVGGNRTWTPFSAEFSLTEGAHTVGVRFLNDFYDPDNKLDRNLIIDVIDVEGPFGVTGAPTRARDRYYTCDPALDGEDACAEEIFSGFAPLAWRRPADPDALADVVGVYREAREAGSDWEVAVHQGFKAILLSPRFLFRLEVDATPADPTPRDLDGFELANRLSYFVWRSMPDAALLEKAADGSILRPDVLEAETRRMMADPKANALADDLIGQWLGGRSISEVEPDYATFPAWDDTLRSAMRREVELFGRAVLLEDRSMLDLLTAEDTFVNRRLADHYGLDASAYGDSFEPVTSLDPPRRGLLGKAGIQTALSYPKRTSPVKRGKWVMGALLCEAPPPAPANVEGLDETQGEGLSLREQMERHRQDPACATCHRVMDPIGFSMEHFDGIGAFRAVDERGEPIDASGTWPGGPTFTDVNDLMVELADDERIPWCMVQTVYAFGLARPGNVDDLPYLRAIEAEFGASGHRFADLVVSIVLSDPFRRRRGLEEGQ